MTRHLSAEPDRIIACHAQVCRHCGAALAPQRQRLRRAYRTEADRQLDRLLRVPAPTPAGRALQAQVEAWRGSYFVFLEDRAAPATNRVSERALRPSVVFRKVTHGFRPTWGADGHALVRSTINITRLGGVRPFEAIRRALQGSPALPA